MSSVAILRRSSGALSAANRRSLIMQMVMRVVYMRKPSNVIGKNSALHTIYIDALESTRVWSGLQVFENTLGG